MYAFSITLLVKGLCYTLLVLIKLKFHDLHPLLVYTPTPSVYAHPIFNCEDNPDRRKKAISLTEGIKASFSLFQTITFFSFTMFKMK